MTTQSRSRAAAFIHKVANTPELPHSAVRLGAWLLALQETTGMGTIQMNKSTIMTGFRGLDGKMLQPGLPTRYKTVAEALENLQKFDMLDVEEGEIMHGYASYRFTMKV